MCNGELHILLLSTYAVCVRQGSALSLFNMFVKEFIVKLKHFNAGCEINGLFVEAIMYADDLNAPSVTGL